MDRKRHGETVLPMRKGPRGKGQGQGRIEGKMNRKRMCRVQEPNNLDQWKYYMP